MSGSFRPDSEPVTTDINSLIQKNFELGIIDQETEPIVQLSKYGLFSHKVLGVILKGVLWVLPLFTLLIFIVDGFNLSVLLFAALVIFVYRPIHKQNERRLQMKVVNRVKEQRNEQLTNELDGSDRSDKGDIKVEKGLEEDFIAEATSINVTANGFFVTFCIAIVTFGLWFLRGWDAITTSFLVFTLALLAFSLWFPYSNFVRRTVVISPKKVRIGQKDIYPAEIKYVICTGNGNAFEFHLTHTKEATQIRMEDEYKFATRDHMKKWCERLNIPFTEK